MYIFFMLIPIVLTSLSFLAKPGVGQPGSALYGVCKADVRAIDNVDASVQDKVSGKVCEAYLLGFIDGDAIRDKTICVNGATPETLARVYVTYMERKPELMDESKVVGLYQSLATTYPCSALGTEGKDHSTRPYPN
jgi:hypothetical protein